MAEAPHAGRGVVLVVDDDADAQFIYPTALEHAGYQVLLAVDGFEALEAIERAHLDAIVLDFAMPRLSGPEVFARLYADPTKRGIPVLACTALAVDSDAPALRAQGYADVLIKPVDPRALVAAVERACLRSIDKRQGSR